MSFKPLPVSPGIPEYDFGGGPIPDFEEGPGSLGNGDGVLPPAAQTPPGIQLDTPFIIPAVPGSLINAASTTFYDVSFDITGLFASAPAGTLLGTVVQPLAPAPAGVATFSFTSTTGIPLLTGTIAFATITGGDGGDAGATFSASGITYTGGLIHAALLASGGTSSPGSMSLSMTDVSPTFGINGGTGFLNAFTANGEGSMTQPPIPEPAALGVAGFVLLMLKRRAK